MRLFLFIALYALSITLYAQENIKEKRAGFKLVLAVDGSAFYESDIKPSAYLNGPNILQLYPGEEVFLEVEQINGIIKSIKTVKENKNPFKTIEASFAQNVEGQKHKGMTLQICNPFNMILTYSAKMFLMKEDKWVNTDALPVKDNLSSFETWPDIIVTIALNDWKFIKE